MLVATEEERKLMAQAPFDVEEYKKDLGVKELWGEKGLPPTNAQVYAQLWN